MATAAFSVYADTPERIIEEGRSITITLNRTSPTTATITWNTPVTAADPTTVPPLAYNGIVVLLDTQELRSHPAHQRNNDVLNPQNNPQTDNPQLPNHHHNRIDRPFPKNGKRYVGDPTADPNLFAGDKIGGAFVIGAFYNDTTTVSLNITGLDPQKYYYVGGYAVDNILRYHYEGVHTYSETYGSQAPPPATPGYQRIELDIQPYDLTGLKSGTTYMIPIALNKPLRTPTEFPHGVDEFDSIDFPGGGPVVEGLDDMNIVNVVLGENDVSTNHESRIPNVMIIFDGSVALTWQAFVDELNRQFCLLGNPAAGVTPPNAGSYYYNPETGGLYQWNGYMLIQLTYISDPNTPTAPNIGDYWVNTTTGQLFQWNGTTWVLQNVIDLPSDPTDMPCGTIWFNGTTAYMWDGTVWIPLVTYIQTTDPEAAPILTCGSYWFNTNNNTLYKWTDITGTCKTGENLVNGQWKAVSPILFPTDPTSLLIGDYWFDLKVGKVKTWNGVTWDIVTSAVVSPVQPPNPAIGQLWYDPTTEELQQWNGSAFIPQTVRVWDKDPANPPAGSVWWDTTNNLLYERDILTNMWVQVQSFYDQSIDPSLPLDFPQNGVVWYDPATKVLKLWDGSQWVITAYILYPTNPAVIVDGVYWHNTTNDTWYIRSGGAWVQIFPVEYPTAPTAPTAGEYWINPTTLQLYQWNGSGWVLLSYTTTSPAPKIGTKWYDTTDKKLKQWNGSQWVLAIPKAIASLVPEIPDEPFPFTSSTQTFTPNPIQKVYDLVLTTGKLGALANIYVVPPSTFPTAEPFFVFDGNQLLVASQLLIPFSGSDPPPRYPQERQLGIGKTEETSERREMVQNVFFALGYPSVQVELTKPNVEFCVNQALKELRRLSSSTYTRKFFFLNVFPNKQRYYLTDISKSFDTIHRVTAVNRRTSTFLGQAEGQAVYGQLVLQHLYQMGTFDLVSYHIISDYIKMMEILFANRVMYLWDEKNHALDIFQTIRQPETMIIDCACERTENDIFADRFLNTWLLNWAVSEAELILAGNRGKFQTLPGAGGGIALNAQDLRASSEKRQTRCLQEINDWIANSNLEEWGMTAEFTFG